LKEKELNTMALRESTNGILIETKSTNYEKAPIE